MAGLLQMTGLVRMARILPNLRFVRVRERNMTTILGYDPGGNGGHGVAALTVDDSYRPSRIVTATCKTVAEVTDWFSKFDKPLGIGIDTLTKWATGESGWRPADLWLRVRYPTVARSVASPNSLYGSMTIGGMAVKGWCFNQHPKAVISETHPKVLYYALRKQKYDWANSSTAMSGFLSERLGVPCKPSNGDEFDSAISCYAVLECLRGSWNKDLHAMSDARCGA